MTELTRQKVSTDRGIVFLTQIKETKGVTYARIPLMSGRGSLWVPVRKTDSGDWEEVAKEDATMIKRYATMKEANSEKHAIGDVWYVKVPFASGFNWYVQFPFGRDSFKTKTEALKWAAAAKSCK